MSSPAVNDVIISGAPLENASKVTPAKTSEIPNIFISFA